MITQQKLTIGFGISTYLLKCHRYQILEKSLDSLFHVVSNTSENIQVEVLLIDDGTPESKIKNDFFDRINSKYPLLTVTVKPENCGISSSKNDQIKWFMGKKLDIIILADDDNIYHQGLFRTIIKAMKIRSFIVAGSITNGYFLCFTKNVVNKIGYFVVPPYVYGGEHYEYVKRYQKTAQISNKELKYNVLDKYVINMFPNSSIDVDRIQENANKQFLANQTQTYIPYETNL